MKINLATAKLPIYDEVAKILGFDVVTKNEMLVASGFEEGASNVEDIMHAFTFETENGDYFEVKNGVLSKVRFWVRPIEFWVTASLMEYLEKAGKTDYRTELEEFVAGAKIFDDPVVQQFWKDAYRDREITEISLDNVERKLIEKCQGDKWALCVESDWRIYLQKEKEDAEYYSYKNFKPGSGRQSEGEIYCLASMGVEVGKKETKKNKFDEEITKGKSKAGAKYGVYIVDENNGNFSDELGRYVGGCTIVKFHWDNKGRWSYAEPLMVGMFRVSGKNIVDPSKYPDTLEGAIAFAESMQISGNCNGIEG